MIEDYWGPSMKLLSDMKFLEALQTYDKDNIPGAVIKKIREKFVDHPLFKPDVIRNVSTACEGLCKWVLAMEVYERVAKVVAPKKIKLAEAEGELEIQMTKLNAKRAELKAVSNTFPSLKYSNRICWENQVKGVTLAHSGIMYTTLLQRSESNQKFLINIEKLYTSLFKESMESATLQLEDVVQLVLKFNE